MAQLALEQRLRHELRTLRRLGALRGRLLSRHRRGLRAQLVEPAPGARRRTRVDVVERAEPAGGDDSERASLPALQLTEEDSMVVVEPMVLQMLVAMMLVLAVVMPRGHGSQVLKRRGTHGSMDLQAFERPTLIAGSRRWQRGSSRGAPRQRGGRWWGVSPRSGLGSFRIRPAGMPASCRSERPAKLPT
jgi:hypothetical protein